MRAKRGTLKIIKVTSAEFRKNLFQIIERVVQGELVQVAHKGRLIRLVLEDRPTKLSRLVQRDTICGTLEDLDQEQQKLDEEMRASLDSKWDRAMFPV